MMLATGAEISNPTAETDLSNKQSVAEEYVDQRFTKSLIPSVGMEFNSEEEARNFWQSYGRRKGFSVRKHYQNRGKGDLVTSRGFVCNKEGFRGKDKRDDQTKESRAETRIGCRARMRIKLLRKTEKYTIYEFIAEHNHELHKPECVHMMRSQRKIGDVQAFEVELANDAGLTQKLSHGYFGIQAGGKENLGFLRVDQKNYLRTKRQRALIYGEVGSLLGYFQNQVLHDPSFFYAVQLDESELITNIFWADARMRIDYELFGEVITFDTTFSTNKEYRPLGVFVGFNHHREMAIFGAALLYDETADSFAWLFEKFLEAHKLKKPQTIFTDQDAAMAKALCEVMPETRHGLCTWHLMQNGIKHLGNLVKDGSHFLTDLKKLMYEYEEELQFEEAWNALLDFYNVRANSWLKKKYTIKEKWGKCFMKTTVTIGMRSTQLSESLNGDLKDYLRSNTDITSFFKHFERIVSEKRYKEKVAEYGATEKLPRIRVKILPLLQQAGKVYTPLIFEKFQEEWEKSLLTVVKEENENGVLRDYLVGSYVDEREYMVTGSKSAERVWCSCKKFETFGILCSHALKVLDVMSIKVIPHAYIAKRWTRNARERTMETIESHAYLENAQLDQIDRYRELCPEAVKLANFASETQEGYVILKKAMREANKQIVEARKKHCNNGNGLESLDSPIVGFSESVDQSVKNLLETVKGLKKKDKVKGGKRKKGWVEKQGKIKKKKCNNDNGPPDQSEKLSIEDASQKDMETPQSFLWTDYDYNTSFTQLLNGSGPLNSETSNHDQCNAARGNQQQSLGGLNGVYAPTSTQGETFLNFF